MQEIFNKVVTHLRQQKCRAEDRHGNCVYLAFDGRMCAVGCLLGDKYKPEMEGRGVSHELFEGMWSPRETKLLATLQATHDEEIFEDWEYHFEKIADRFGLTIPV